MISVLSRKLLQGSKFCTQQVIQAPKKFSQTISKARPVMNLYELSPNLVGKVFIAPNATVVGDIILGNDIYIGHGTIIRGDINRIRFVFSPIVVSLIMLLLVITVFYILLLHYLLASLLISQLIEILLCSLAVPCIVVTWE